MRRDTCCFCVGENKKISFKYYRWNEKKCLVERHPGKIFQISPLGLVWMGERYYLIGYDFEETSTTLYAHWMKKPDITLHNPYIDENGRRVCDVVNFGHYLSWDNDDELHYTDGLVNEYDEKVRIPWIVLKVDGDDAFLVSKYALDSLKYNESRSGVSWEDSTIRSWLNGYDASKNAEGKDYSYIRKKLTKLKMISLKI